MAATRSLKGLVALVTGGASGLGRATVERFIRNGSSVLICDLPTSSGDGIAKSLGESCVFAPTDVSSEADVKMALEIVKSKFKKLDVVVNCAGISVAFKLYNFLKETCHKLSDIEKVTKVNTVGTFNVNRLAVELMAENPPNEDGQRGVLINTSGSSAFDGFIGQSAYSSTAGSIVSMTLPMARDLAPQGIRCCTIAPGFMDTELMGTLPPEVINFISDTTPFPKRFGKPDEFAHLVQCIIENPMLNGEVIRLDGGSRFRL
ncbi:3-hydroxyacyl-CoA dehydrogenase type-2-like [Uloborus diversus]|uniref:3-hydroxyacyl-CoA dehydrogenase type-2-like n=1 Tax=Uloborus diversus TaxID=327109 RepID=UPI00240965C2|nr:3-hydroxyacyl-CoA dehydrogenase type-2-like [Uloborus diversus]